LYEAVDFHPEEEEKEKTSAEQEEREEEEEAGGGARSKLKEKKTTSDEGGSWVELSFNCLLNEAKLTLNNNETGIPLAAICLQGLQTEISLGGGGGDGDGGEAADGDEQNEGSTTTTTTTPRSPATTGLIAGVTLTTLYGLDYTSTSAAATGLREDLIFFGRGPAQTYSTEDAKSTSRSTTLRPVLRLQYTASASKLDLLVQPLRFRLHPLLLQTLVQFIPPAVEESYVGSCMAALNALSDTSRAAYKAERLQKLGPPLDLVAKIVDVEVLLVGSTTSSSENGGILLRTGAILLHSVGQAASFAASEPIFKVLDRLRDVMLSQSTARTELESAVEVVEKRLVYQRIDFSVAALQTMAISPSTTTTTPATFSPEIEILSNFLLPSTRGGSTTEDVDNRINTPQQAPAVSPPLTPTDSVSVILHPLKLSGSIQAHRLALDFAVPQLLLRLDVDPIKATVQYEDVKLIMDIMASGGTSNEEVRDGAVPSSSSSLSPPEVVVEDAAAGGSPHLAGPVQTSIHLSLSSIDIHYADTGGFTSHFSLKQGSLHFQAHAPSSAGAASEVGIKLTLDSLFLKDSSSHPSVACALPAVLSPVYRLGKKVFIGSAVVDVVPMVVVDGVKVVDVQLEDVILDGFNEEPGNFIAR
jgi:hypothetical protein